MRILLVTPSYPPVIGGLEIVVHNLAQALCRRGHDVTVLTNPERNAAKRVTDSDGPVTVLRTPLGFSFRSMRAIAGSLRWMPACLQALCQVGQHGKPELVNVHFVSGGHALVALAAARVFKAPVVASIHGSDVANADGSGRPLSRSCARLVRTAEGLTANSERLAEVAGQLVPESARSWHVIRNGIALDEFDAISGERVHSRAYVLAAGRLEHVKGFDVLLKAFTKVAVQEDGVDLLIAGDGSQRASLERLASCLGIADSVRFLGLAGRRRMAALLGQCEVLAVPSRHEGLGVVNLEAMAAGKAIVATRVGGVPEIVEDGKNGILVDPEDPQALAAGIRLLLDRPALRAQMGARGRALVEHEYSWEHVVTKFEAVYEEAWTTYQAERSSG